MLQVQPREVRSILTRSSGYLSQVCSHSLNPYQGCSLGRSLCGVACYVRHNPYITRGRRWGSFLEPKINAAPCYRAHYQRERNWAQQTPGGRFSIFMASSTDPFPPQERRYGVTGQLLAAMLELPPQVLIVQTHSALVVDALDALQALSQVCDVRVHLSIESDRDRLPGLPRSAFSVEKRLQAAAQSRRLGLFTVATLSPLLPIARPADFFGRLQECVEAVVIDHFIEGDGSRQGSRTRRTALPAAMEQVDPSSLTLDYRQQVIGWARQYFPGRVGVGPRGFAGCYE